MEGDESEPVSQDCDNKVTVPGGAEGTGDEGEAEQSSGASTDSSTGKSCSSPFHGFSSQDEAEDVEAEATEAVSEEAEPGGGEKHGGSRELKSQLLADFGIGN